MSNDTEFRPFILEQLEGLGTFEIKKMFGGLALLRERCAFATIKRGVLWLRAADETKSRFEDWGMPRYSYGKNNDRHRDFCQTPAEVLENVEELSNWTEGAILVAQRK